MADFYIEYTRTIIEVYRVEAKSDNEAKKLVQTNHNRNAPNIVDRKDTEKYKVVNGMYKNGKLVKPFQNFYQ